MLESKENLFWVKVTLQPFKDENLNFWNVNFGAKSDKSASLQFKSTLAPKYTHST